MKSYTNKSHSKMGKHTLYLDLHSPSDRSKFDDSLSTADVLIDGYRPGSLTRLGYGPSALASVAISRNRGINYISESCFGALPPVCRTYGFRGSQSVGPMPRLAADS